MARADACRSVGGGLRLQKFDIMFFQCAPFRLAKEGFWFEV